MNLLNDLESLDTPAFTTAEIALAIGIPAETLRTWIKRGDIELVQSEPENQRHPGTGRNRLLSLRRAIHIGLVAELVKTGLSPSEASTLALHYSDIGDGTAAWVGEGEPVITRMPGCLYQKDGPTIFRVFNRRDGKRVASVDRGSVTRNALFVMGGTSVRSVIAVNMDALDGEIRSALRAIARR
jgi:hypothetical protein